MRVGNTATKKLGTAVVHNQARRCLRAVVDAMAMRRATAGRDYVLIARASTPGRTYAALERDFETALKRLDWWQAVEADEIGGAE